MAPRRFPRPDVRAEPRAVGVDGSELTRRTAASPREEGARANRARGAIGDAAADDTDMARVAMNVAGRPPATESAASGARASRRSLPRTKSRIRPSSPMRHVDENATWRVPRDRPGSTRLARTPRRADSFPRSVLVLATGLRRERPSAAHPLTTRPIAPADLRLRVGGKSD